MRNIVIHNNYKKDFKLVKRQISSEKWGIEKIREVVLMLQTQDILPQSLNDHNLWGEYQGFRECHIYGDLVIVYKRDDKELYLRRIGRHQDLFKNY